MISYDLLCQPLDYITMHGVNFPEPEATSCPHLASRYVYTSCACLKIFMNQWTSIVGYALYMSWKRSKPGELGQTGRAFLTRCIPGYLSFTMMMIGGPSDIKPRDEDTEKDCLKGTQQDDRLFSSTSLRECVVPKMGRSWPSTVARWWTLVCMSNRAA